MKDCIVVVDGRQKLGIKMVKALRDVLKRATPKLDIDIILAPSRDIALKHLPPGRLGLVSFDSRIRKDVRSEPEHGQGFLLHEDLRRQGYAGHVVLYSGNPHVLSRGRELDIAGKPLIVVDKVEVRVDRWAQICCKPLLVDAELMASRI